MNDAFDMEGEHGAINETNKIKDYFWSKANWLYFEFGIGFDFLITQKYAIGIDAKLYLPPTPPDIAKNIFLGGARMGLGMRVTIF
ncbi:hypothetical protein FACS1894102_1400 [Spirochaetia bacterium]|nr:hypothetical protein FACS1894102_1400 [Spirochaetia bacterium]